jgi:histidyl-tRNA synthetase
MKSTIQSVKGTRDFYPEDMALRNFIYSAVRRASESFGYQEWEGPFLETIDLYAAKSGEELVKEQAFVFPDRGGDLITLRPELTPTLARLVAQRQKQLAYPLRWWSFGPFWRYERPQKGRAREFFQWNIDLIGVDTPEADAEIVAIGATFLREAGLTPDQVNILVGNRKLINEELSTLDVPLDQRKQVFRLIDRRDRLTPQDWQAYARETGLSATQIEGLEAVLANDQLWRKSDDMQRFFASIEALGISPYIRFAPHIVRGLDYYTGIVFEAWDRDGEFRAILGGGRYDNLVSDVGGEPLPATGFAMGDMVVGLVLKKFACIPETLGASPAQVLVTVFDPASFPASYSLATRLRQAGLNVACYPEAAKLARQIKYGDRMGMRLIVILGPDELAKGAFTLKDLRQGEQHTLPLDQAVIAVRQILAGETSSKSD